MPKSAILIFGDIMEKEFNTASIPKLVFKLGIPAMLAQFFNILYSIVDRIFVGNIEGKGELSLAAIGICAPALTAITAFAFMVGIGGASLMSISMGRGDRQQAQRAINNSVLMLIAISIAVTVSTLLFKKNILYMLGSSDNIYPLANSYFTIYILGTIASLVGMGMNQFILAQGYAREGMLSVIIGAAVNVILDPVFIYGFKMGVEGAAIATVISQFCTMLYVLRFLIFRKLTINIGIGLYSIKTAGKILSIGIMSFLITLLDNFMIVLLNVQLRRYGGELTGDKYIACAAIIQSFMILVNNPGQGITTGCGTLFSFHYGAGNYKKVMQSFKYVLLLCGIYLGILLILSQTIPHVFVRIFSRNIETIDLTAEFLSKYTLGIIGVAVQYAFVDGLTAMGKIKYAFPISFFRKILYIVCVIYLPLVTRLENIFYSSAISDIVGSLFTLIVFFAFIKPRLKNEML